MAARHGWELAERDRQFVELTDRVAQLERHVGRDSSNPSKPPSSDSPFERVKRDATSKDRSLRKKSGLKPGKQPGAGSSTMRLIDDPDETYLCPPLMCRCCAGDLSARPVTAANRRQVREITSPPPRTIEYRVQAKECASCGATTVGHAPAHAKARASFGPATNAQACSLIVGHHLPVGRAVSVLEQLGGIRVSTGWMASVRGKAAVLLEPFMESVRTLLRQAPVLHADESPAHAGEGLEYVHVLCTRYLTHLHTG